MNISFDVLESALSEITQLGHDETTFLVGSTPITMRSLTPEEEFEVQRYANQVWSEDDENSSGEALAFVDRFRMETISRAIVAVGNVDLREVDFLDTGDVLEGTGKSIQEPRHMVLRKLVQKWGGSIREGVFRKYTEMLKQIEKKAEEAIEFEPSDTEAEVQRLETRLEELKQEKENTRKREHPAYAVAEFGQVDGDQRKKSLSIGSDVSDPSAPQPSAPQPSAPQPSAPQRKPIVPQMAPPPGQKTQDNPDSQERPQQIPANSQDLTKGGDSFVGSGDLSEAVAEADAQLMAARLRNGGPVYPSSDSALSSVHGLVQPPHKEAAEVASELEQAEKERQDVLRKNGIEAYALSPPEEMDLGEERPKPEPSHPNINPKRGSNNPRYNPRK